MNPEEQFNDPFDTACEIATDHRFEAVDTFSDTLTDWMDSHSDTGFADVLDSGIDAADAIDAQEVACDFGGDSD